jgi:transketolase
MDTNLDELSINTIRFLAVDMVQKANSGHPGAPLGASPMAYVLWDRPSVLSCWQQSLR